MMVTQIVQNEAVLTCRLRCKEKISVVIGLLCFGGSAILLLLVFLLFKPCSNCQSSKTDLVAGKICGGFAILLFLVGSVAIRNCALHRRRRYGPSFEVIISHIPAEDLEKSPAPLLPYHHTPHYQPMDLCVEASTRDLPDYFTSFQNSYEVETSSGDLPDYCSAVQNIDDVYSSFEVGFWTEDVPKTPPPCYEQALEMTTSADAAP